ncbi:MAG: S8/S53 family peptidase, partial [Bacteroidota bacterium]
EAIRQSIPLTIVSERSIERRRKVRSSKDLVDYTDLPVEQAYVDQVAKQIVRVRQRSRWFNSVSVVATKARIASLEGLPFVTQIDLLARFSKNQTEQEEAAQGVEQSATRQEDGIHSLDYGASFGQVNQVNVPAVHDLGNHAEGVFVGVFDNGFRLPNHESFASMNIVATYDFVDHKVSVVPNNPSPSFGSHGVNTLSTIGGYKPGQLIGPAFGANFILARTENDSSETPIEEDNWVAAIEWADSIGVDVTSTSLGYLTYDAPYTSWTWQDMNGNTTVITRAADWAVSRGIVVVNSAGNEGYSASHNTLGAPADGDSVLSVGAVSSTGTRSSFSSVGPTTSIPPRIKPDVMAQGSSVRVASATNTTGYGSASGTSFSCPLAAGVAALIISARPNATPLQVMNSMRATASRAGSPDNQYGWGILNALAAINDLPLPIQLQYFTGIFVRNSNSVQLNWGTLSEVNNYGFVVQRRTEAREFADLPNSFVPGHGTTNEPQHYSFVDTTVLPGIWLYRLKQIDLDGTVHYTETIRVDVLTGVQEATATEFALHQNYPNPFNSSTMLSFNIPYSTFVVLKVQDVLGREVATVVNEELKPGSYQRTLNTSGWASGVYVYRLRAGSHTDTRKLVVLK